MSIEVVQFFDRLPSGWRPRSDAQRLALVCPAELLKFGGAAGSLKSSTLLVKALTYHERPGFRGIIFRKSYPEIKFLIDRTRDIYSNTGGRYYEAEKQWKWPWGATIEFRHLENDSDVYKHQGPEYQFVGFDESTHFKEFQLRYLLNSRMRSTNDIPLRMMLATNPGGRGHAFHKSVFQGPKCIHCIEKQAKELGIAPKYLAASKLPGKLYYDARWHSDNELINVSTCFIPGRVTDHNLLDAKYLQKLAGLPIQLREALLSGCWEAFEGQFFDCFDPAAHVINRADVKEKDWWPHWVSIDYAFGHACAAYLWTMDPTTRHVYTLDEYIIRRRKAIDVAKDLQKAWGDKNIKAWYLGRDSFKHDGGDDFSHAELMSQETGIYFDEAYNDRISGAMLMYTLLSENRWSICLPNCALLPMAIPTRVHAEKDANDVEKVVTEDEDDAYDAARYGLASHINPTEKPADEALRDMIKEEKFSSDPTIFAMQMASYLAKQNQVSKASMYRTRGRR